MNDDWHEETTDPSYADAHNFYKVEQWDIGDKIGEARLVYASSNLQRAHKAFDRHVKQRPNGRITIRQGIRVVRRWSDGRS
jgi:hypothetical protein